MPERGAQPGNTNAKKGKDWQLAIRKALALHSGGEGATKGLEKIAKKLIAAAENGDAWALKELGDRIDGKPAQSMTVSGDESAPLVTRVERVIVKSKD